MVTANAVSKKTDACVRGVDQLREHCQNQLAYNFQAIKLFLIVGQKQANIASLFTCLF